jgi:hypothetical protein
MRTYSLDFHTSAQSLGNLQVQKIQLLAGGLRLPDGSDCLKAAFPRTNRHLNLSHLPLLRYCEAEDP